MRSRWRNSKPARFSAGGRLRLRMASQCGLLLVLIALISIPVRGQEQPPRFAVSSIKLSRPDAQMRDMKISISGPNLRVVNCTLDELLLNALQLFWRSEGGPDWVRERRFDILANAEEGTSPDNLVLTQMVFELLRDRFKLAFHKDSKDVPGLALTLGKKQPDLIPSKEGELRRVTGGTSMVFTKIGMADFARILSGSLNMPIVDRTGLKGEFDFTLQPDGDGNFGDRLQSSVEGLGFRLVGEKVKVDYATIDHAELPDAN
jgi:uncharacterized protein (TIGR03435 family)